MATVDQSRARRLLGVKPSTAILVPTAGSSRHQYRLRGRRVVIGADPRCDIVLDDATVSRRHAVIVRDRHDFLLSDLASTNGTFLGGRQIVGTVRLTPGDRIRFGGVSFTFFGPTPATDSAARQHRPVTAIPLLVAIIALASVTWYFAGTIPGLPSIITRRSETHGEPGWLVRLNHYRRLAKLDPVTDDPALSRADALHARYVVGNYAAEIHSGRAGVFMHLEEPGKPFFTPEGRAAARLSDVTFESHDPPVAPDPGWAIDNWITAPFHRLSMLNPDLERVGYGQFCERGLCAAALNVQSGIATDAPGANSRAVMFPAARSTIRDGTFATDNGEWPSPLTPCPGYTKPTGLPITLQLGRDVPAVLQSYSLEREGSPVQACGYDAGAYRNPQPLATTMGRRALTYFGAIVIIPRKPLVRGNTYLVRATVSGAHYVWWFKVAP